MAKLCSKVVIAWGTTNAEAPLIVNLSTLETFTKGTVRLSEYTLKGEREVLARLTVKPS